MTTLIPPSSPSSFGGTSASAPFPGNCVPDELRRAIAIAIRDASSYAEVIELAEQYAEPIEPSEEPVLNGEEFDRLLDPLVPEDERIRLFLRFLHDAVAHGRIEGLTPAHLANEVWGQHLFDETLGWGEVSRLLLADERMSELSVWGAKVSLGGPGVATTELKPYATSREPLSRAEFLVLATGGQWNRRTPSTSITFRSGTRVMLAREPVVPPRVPGQPGFACVVQRGSTMNWTLRSLVAHRMLNGPTAALLSALLHARCSFLVSGPPNTGKTAMIEALLNTVPQDESTVFLDPPSGPGRIDNGGRENQLHLTVDSPPEALRAFLATFSDGLTIDRFVARVVDAGTADVALTMVTSGVASLLSIDAGTPTGAYSRLIRLADTGRPGAQAWQDDVASLTQSIHVHVHLEQAGRGRLGYVGEVRLLAKVPDHPLPVLVPMITAEPSLDHFSWSHSAWIRDGELRFLSLKHVVPLSVRNQMADVPEEIWEQWDAEPLERPTPVPIDPHLRAYRQVLRRARAAFNAGDFVTAAEQITEAAAIRSDSSVEDLADNLLAHAGTLEVIDRQIAEMATAISAALDQGRPEEALALLNAPVNILVRRARNTNPDWRALDLRLDAMQVSLEDSQRGLQAAQAAEERGDLRGAYSAVTTISATLLPPDLQHTVLLTRHSLLTQLIAQMQEAAEERDRYAAELAQIAHELETVKDSLAWPSANGRTHDQGSSSSSDSLISPGASQLSDTPPSRVKATGVMGWLDAALTRNRERLHQQQSRLEAHE